MPTKMLKRFYRLEPQYIQQNDTYKQFFANDTLYTIVPVTHLDEEVLLEIFELSNHMIQHGDRYASAFHPSRNGKYLVTFENVDYVLLKNKPIKGPINKRLGRKLAKFHTRGRMYPKKVEKVNRSGQWRKLWEKRLMQMEKVWLSIAQSEPDLMFHRLFVDTFPYYMGLSENAIQYLVDTEMDESRELIDHGTVCHQRFHHHKWKSNPLIRNPFDWVFDHAGRDISEWIRSYYFHYRQTYQPGIQTFLQDYEAITPLSAFSWRLIYARLLFPLHYYECVENYFTSSSEEQKHSLEETLRLYMKHAKEYEQFLRNFKMFIPSHSIRQQIPDLQWLYTKS